MRADGGDLAAVGGRVLAEVGVEVDAAVADAGVELAEPAQRPPGDRQGEARHDRHLEQRLARGRGDAQVGVAAVPAVDLVGDQGEGVVLAGDQRSRGGRARRSGRRGR